MFITRATMIALAATGIAALMTGSVMGQSKQQFAQLRERMVEEEIVAAGITNPRVVEAIRKTPRHEFVAPAHREHAYFDMALPIGAGQTISPPFVVAYMTEALEPQPEDTVLEIGTGSGYQAAVLSPLVKDVYSIEIVEFLGKTAARTLKRLKQYDNVHTKVGDGYQGWPEHAPFDKIIVTCSPENVPQALIDQLKEGGRLVIPLGQRYQQTLYLYRKVDGKLVSESLKPTLFVPMTGAAEARRQIKPDPLNPQIVNGGFEDLDETTQEPLGWHYLRQMKGVEDGTAPAGQRFVTFHNQAPGRGSQALQGFAIDGRMIKELELSCQVKTDGVKPGATVEELPAIVISFYDERRATVGHRVLGPWRGTQAWQREVTRIEVPTKAREAIIRLGLLGGVGEVSFDALELKVISEGR